MIFADRCCSVLWCPAVDLPPTPKDAFSRWLKHLYLWLYLTAILSLCIAWSCCDKLVVLLITRNLTPRIQEPGHWGTRRVRNDALWRECNAVCRLPVCSPPRLVYLNGKGSDVYEEVISKGSFNISVWHLVVFLIQYCYYKWKEFDDESGCVRWVKKIFLVS